MPKKTIKTNLKACLLEFSLYIRQNFRGYDCWNQWLLKQSLNEKNGFFISLANCISQC